MTVEMEDLDLLYRSDSDDGGEDEHKRLLAAISKLDKRKRVLPSERKEPSLQVSEFHLAKEDDSSLNTVQLRELAQSLNLQTSQGDILRQLRATERKTKTLPKPQEKIFEKKIRREVTYKNVQEQLSEWDPVVYQNRVSENLVFPLKSSDVKQIDSKEFLSSNQGATELEREMAAVLNDSPLVQKEREENEDFSLSLEEMIQRRKELAKLRAQESYCRAKAHRQNKIKSKSYHRHARRERIRSQIKEFEELQQKDPEAALERLEEIEKQRILERASLRHRSTGQWAQNHAVRAKYDKESRQVLSEQLKISKELTQKVQVESESSDEESSHENDIAPSDNPWMSQSKTEVEVDEFLSGYRKYWNEKGKEMQNDLEDAEKNSLVKETSSDEITQATNENPDDDVKAKALLESAVVSYSEIYNNEDQEKTKPKTSQKGPSSPVAKLGKKSKQTQLLKKKTKKEQKLTAIASCGNWTVTPLELSSKISPPEASPDVSLNVMFDDLREKITAKAQKKIADLKGEMDTNKKCKKQVNGGGSASLKRAAKSKSDPSDLLKMKRQKLQIDLDEKLDEGSGEISSFDDSGLHAEKLAKQIKLADSGNSDKQKAPASLELDPNKFMKTVPVKLRTALPDEITGGDEGLDDSDNEGQEKEKHLTISEAFADDDVVADFSQEKKDAVDKDKPEEISLSLPGWGEWAGHKIAPNKRKRKRFMVQMPKAAPRRDENKGNLIINEREDSSARAHQVSEVPFPFTRVKDYEASVRAPVSNTFIPESAFRKLVKPAVRTKLGAIITPMEKEVLMKKKKKD